MMKRTTITSLLGWRYKVKILTILALLLVSVVLGQLILTKGGKLARAIGESENNPYVINEDGFIWQDQASPFHSYYVRKSADCSVRFVNTTTGLAVGKGSNHTNNCYTTQSKGRIDYVGISNDLTNRNVKIDGNIVVAMWGSQSHTFASFTVSGGAVVTHAPLVYLVGSGNGNDYENRLNAIASDFTDSTSNSVGYTPCYSMVANDEKDFDIDTGALTSSGALKKVDITAGKMRILDGQINVVGRGFPGANGNGNTDEENIQRYFTDFYAESDGLLVPVGLPKGYGGYGGYRDDESNNGTSFGGGGSGFKNVGGRATFVYINTSNTNVVADKLNTSRWTFNNTSVTAATTVVNNLEAAAFHYGAGGGASGRYGYNGVNKVDRGGSGGGTITLNISANGELELHSASKLNASGQNGLSTSGNTGYGGGGGAGGTIILNATVKVLDTTTNNTSVSGGLFGGGVGSLLQRSDSTSAYLEVGSLPLGAIVKSNGGTGGYKSGTCTSSNCGGGGGGGGVMLTGSVIQNCTITSADDGSIPAACENQDVVIDGATVYADNVKILQSNRAACSDLTILDCDSKRHFNSLIIKNNGVLTHNALTVNDFDDAQMGDPVNNNGRVKKVDIEVVDNLTLESGGKIDVSGKGYPMRVSSLISDWTPAGYGPGGGSGEPFATCDNSPLFGGGGSHGGVGSPTRPNYQDVYGPDAYDLQNANPINPQNYGSSGGGGTMRRCPLWFSNISADSAGASGGGIIRLFVRSGLVLDPSSQILANGTGATLNNGVTGGGGAGGTINITYNIFNNSNTGTSPLVTGGTVDFSWVQYGSSHSSGWPGVIYGAIGPTAGSNLQAKGGYGGGGGGIISLAMVQSQHTLQKTLTSIDRGSGLACMRATKVGCNSNFNAYSLQKDDVIKVTINIGGGGSSSFNIKDELLQTKYQAPNYTCSPDGSTTFSVTPDSAGANPLVWTNLPGNTTEIYYDCVVGL